MKTHFAETRKQRIADLREHAAAGLLLKIAADEMSISYAVASRLAREEGIVFIRSTLAPKGIDHRAEAMRCDYQNGDTLQEIAVKHKLSRERVRQILFNAFGKISDEGGVAALKRQLAEISQEQRSLRTLPVFTKTPVFVYIIEAQNGMAKIGSAEEPKNRLQAINCHSPIACRLVACWHGRMKDEQALHRRFDAQRRHSEWFELSGDLAEFVKEKFGTGLDAPVLEWSEIIFPPRKANAAIAAAKRSAAMKRLWADPVERANFMASKGSGLKQQIAAGRAFVAELRPDLGLVFASPPDQAA